MGLSVKKVKSIIVGKKENVQPDTGAQITKQVSVPSAASIHSQCIQVVYV